MVVSDAQRAEIERACTRLAADYSHYLDKGLLDEWAALFLEEGEWGPAGQTHKGRKAIRASLTLPADFVGMHVFYNARIDVVSAEEARGAMYVALYRATRVNGVGVANSTEPAFVGAYDDVYRKTGEGWRFAKRTYAPLISKAQQ